MTAAAAGLVADVHTAAGQLPVDVTVRAVAGEVLAVVGPNGSGKTTLLRTLAGLHPLVRGSIVLDGEVLEDSHSRRDPGRRGVGWVPQDLALFPHLSALDNAAFGPRSQGRSRRQSRGAAADWLGRLGVGELAGSKPGRLSGGQAQRVALARALAAEPRLLLLDEPLAALDTSTRTDVRRLLRTHLAGYDGVVLLVTHDPIDAVTLADRLVVLESGRVVQDGVPAEVTRFPRSRWAAHLLGWNAWPGRLTADGIVLDGGGRLVGVDPPATGGAGLALAPPQAVALHRTRPEGSPRNVWPGTVDELSLLGGSVRVRVAGHGEAAPRTVVAEVTPQAVADLGLVDGAPIWVSLKATEIRLATL